MTDCLVVGLPNVGKTCFVINFAEYMGLKNLKLFVKQPAGYTSIKNYLIDEARNQLISEKPNYTKEIQAIKIEIPAGKVKKEIKIIDSCGLRNGIHTDSEIRKAMAQTIRHLHQGNLILHIIDIKNIEFNKSDLLPPVDKMVYDFARIDKKYVILINKIDLKEYQENLYVLKEKLSSETILPISALYHTGFDKVKKLVLNYV